MTGGNGDQMESGAGTRSAEAECLLRNAAQMVHLMEEGCFKQPGFSFCPGLQYVKAE